MKINHEKARSKMEDLDIKRNALNWGKVKGKTYQDKIKNG